MASPIRFLLLPLAVALAASTRADVETIVCLRHGEKTPTELGQLSVRGLNRSLALPGVLLARFGRPAFIFAPDPLRNEVGGGGREGRPEACYVRPLATIEPTAIRCGLPVNTAFGFREIGLLEAELLKPKYRNALVFVAWEHSLETQFAAKLLQDLGAAADQVPHWPSKDFDSLYVIRIDRSADGKTSVAFTHEHEGLNGMSEAFPSPAR